MILQEILGISKQSLDNFINGINQVKLKINSNFNTVQKFIIRQRRTNKMFISNFIRIFTVFRVKKGIKTH